VTGSHFLTVTGPDKYDQANGVGHFLIAIDIAKVQPMEIDNFRIEPRSVRIEKCAA
jgi:hypothetical protein